MVNGGWGRKATFQLETKNLQLSAGSKNRRQMEICCGRHWTPEGKRDRGGNRLSTTGYESVPRENKKITLCISFSHYFPCVKILNSQKKFRVLYRMKNRVLKRCDLLFPNPPSTKVQILLPSCGQVEDPRQGQEQSQSCCCCCSCCCCRSRCCLGRLLQASGCCGCWR